VPLRPIQIVPVPGLPEIATGDDLAALIAGALEEGELCVAGGDIFVVTQKIVSKAEGRIVQLGSVLPSERAKRWALKYEKDPRLIELVLREARRIVRMERGLIIAETRHGFVCANAGVDTSNAPAETAILLPEDPDRSAEALRQRLTASCAVEIGVIISDTFGRPWREGLVNVAIGVAGIAPLADYRATRDTSGRILQSTVLAVADELASAAELAMGKSENVPVVIVKGYSSGAVRGTGRDLIRPAERDLFR